MIKMLKINSNHLKTYFSNILIQVYLQMQNDAGLYCNSIRSSASSHTQTIKSEMGQECEMHSPSSSTNNWRAWELST